MKSMGIRLPDDIREWIELRSIRHHRSMNSELIAILDFIRDGEENQSVPGEDFFKFAAPSFVFNKSAQETPR